MKTYNKILTLWQREDAKPHNIIIGQYANPIFEFLKNNKWVATEKVDGTNIRIIWDGNKISFGGKTDNAQIPTKLFDKLMELFGGENNEQKIEAIFGKYPVCLYGEGFGGNIQTGDSYGDFDFVLFDVKIGDWWLERDNIEDIAKKLDIKVVPIIKIDTLQNLSDLVRDGFQSQWGDFTAEGIVARPKVELLDRNGERIITKLKYKDFLKLNQ